MRGTKATADIIFFFFSSFIFNSMKDIRYLISEVISISLMGTAQIFSCTSLTVSLGTVELHSYRDKSARRLTWNVVVLLPKPRCTEAVTCVWDLPMAPSQRRILSPCNQPEPWCGRVKLNSTENKQLLREGSKVLIWTWNIWVPPKYLSTLAWGKEALPILGLRLEMAGKILTEKTEGSGTSPWKFNVRLLSAGPVTKPSCQAPRSINHFLSFFSFFSLNPSA